MEASVQEGLSERQAPAHPVKPSKKKPLESRRLRIAVAVAAALAVFIGLHYYFYFLHHRDTDDAFIDGHIYMISPSVPGPVIQVAVEDNQIVKKGDLLAAIDPRSYEALLGQAHSQAEAVAAMARQAGLDLARYARLYRQKQISQQSYDHAVAAADVAKASAKSAAQKEDAARLDLSYARLVSPADGRVTKKNVEVGDYVQTGQVLMAVVGPDVWVTANFKETQLKGMRPGDPVAIEADAYPGRVFKGHVDSIQDGSGARFSLFPPENATGNYVKVVQRIPVKIVFDDPPAALPFLAPGMSVVPVVETR